MTTLTSEQKRDLEDTMMHLAQIQTDIFLFMVGQGVPAMYATELISNQLTVMMEARLPEAVNIKLDKE